MFKVKVNHYDVGCFVSFLKNEVLDVGVDDINIRTSLVTTKPQAIQMHLKHAIRSAPTPEFGAHRDILELLQPPHTAVVRPLAK